LFVYVIYSRGTKRQTVGKIKKLNLFSTITPLTKNTLKLETKKPVYHQSTKKIQKIMKLLTEISTVKEPPKMYPVIKVSKRETEPKMIHIFSDIDSTLTHTSVSALNRNVKTLIQKFIEKNCYFYFCTGRTYQDVERLRKLYNTGEYGIAENGGIIVGMSVHRGRIGDKNEPNKLIQYLWKNNIPFTIDPNQGNRRTEYVLLRDSIKETTLKKAIKKSKANVEYHASKNTYHISKRGVNKGTAIEFLTSSEELDLDPNVDEVIAMGDSDLDLPMFSFVDKGYIVGKPDRELRKKLSKFKIEIKQLSLAPDAIVELYQELFPYS